jgi:hypothetical protein
MNFTAWRRVIEAREEGELDLYLGMFDKEKCEQN